MKTNFKLNSTFCYESYPCCHDVEITDENGTRKCNMRAPSIIDYIVKNNVPVSVKEFEHFEYCFTSKEHHKYLQKLKDDRAKRGDVGLSVNSDGYEMNKYIHLDKPQITFSMKVFRSSLIDLPHIIKLEKEDNNFLLKYNRLQTLLSSTSYYFLNDIYCIKNNKKYYPNNLKVKYQGTELNFYGKCMNNFILCHKELFKFPVYLNKDLEVCVDEEVDSIYCKLISTRNQDYKFKNYWDNIKIIVFSHEIISNIESIDGYFTHLYISSNENGFNNLEAITFSNNNNVFLDNVNIELLKIEDNLLHIALGCDEDHGLYINNNNFKITYHLKDNTIKSEFIVYGERFSKLESK